MELKRKEKKTRSPEKFGSMGPRERVEGEMRGREGSREKCIAQ